MNRIRGACLAILATIAFFPVTQSDKLSTELLRNSHRCHRCPDPERARCDHRHLQRNYRHGKRQ